MSLKYEIAIDTETSGLQIKHGCRGFLVTAADTEATLFEWWFEIDPYTRKVIYDDETVLDFYNTVYQYDIWIFHNGLFDLNVIREMQTESVTLQDWEDLFSQVEIEDTMLMCHAENSLTTNALKPSAFYLIDYPEDDEKELVDAVKKSRTIAKKLGWAIAEPDHPHLTALVKDKPKCDYWLPHTLAKHHPRLVPKHYATVCRKYALGDVDRTLGIYFYCKNSFSPEKWKAYKKNVKCIFPTYQMVNRGFALKEGQVPSTLKKLNEVKEHLTSSIQELVETTNYTPPNTKAQTYEPGDDFTFNEGSTIQLQKLLFETFDLPCPKFTAKGNPSTDKEVIKTLLDDEKLQKNVVAMKVLENILGLRKVNATERYLNSYNKYQVNDILYPSLHPSGTKTLRYSSSNPNGQNISVQEAKGFEHLGVSFSLRNMFGPPEGHIWACIDYSQIQLRIFAYACQDRSLIESFERGDDVHDTVARAIFNVPPGKEPTKKQRTAAKGINFGIIFGAGKNKIERMTGMPGTFDMFRTKFPLVESYIKSQAEISKKIGYCLTMGGYPLNVTRSKAYKACNYIVQGTEGEIVKEAIVLTSEYCNQPSILFHPVMTIHDEIIFQSKNKLSMKDTDKMKPKSQLLTLQKLMNKAAENVGVVSKVDCSLTDTLWSLAS